MSLDELTTETLLAVSFALSGVVLADTDRTVRVPGKIRGNAVSPPWVTERLQAPKIAHLDGRDIARAYTLLWRS